MAPRGGADQLEAVATQISDIAAAVGVLGDAAVCLVGAARKAEALERRQEQRYIRMTPS